VLIVRYLLASVVFFLVLLARLLADWVQEGGGRRILAVAVLLLFMSANGWHVARLIELGRGGYLEAVRFMAVNRKGDTFTVGSDQDLRVGMMLTFYAKYLPEPMKLGYYPTNTWPPNGPEWLVLHRQDKEEAPPRIMADRFRNRYDFAREFRYAGLSGYRWFVYRNERDRDREH
jgi:hypothetical protein